MSKKKKKPSSTAPALVSNNAAEAEEKESDKEEAKSSDRIGELAVSIAVAIVLAVLIKFVALDIFVIPTGSMEPTLHGRMDGGDRVLCTKVNYYWRDPERWEVFVFKYPFKEAQAFAAAHGGSSPRQEYNGENFIKRCVGLSGEEIGIAWGDVFRRDLGDVTSKGERLVKPDSLQRDIWIQVYDESFADLSDKELQHFWKVSGPGAWAIKKDGNLRLEGQLSFTFTPLTRYGVMKSIPDRYVRRQVVRFKCPVCGSDLAKTVSSPKITGRCLKCSEYLLEKDVVYYGYRTGMPSPAPAHERTFPGVVTYDAPKDQHRAAPFHATRDLRFLSNVTFDAADSELVVSLLSDTGVLDAVFTAGEAGSVKLLLDGRPIEGAQTEVGLDPKKKHSVEFYTLDSMARVFVDGKQILDLQAFDPVKPDRYTKPSSSQLSFASRSGVVTLHDMQIDRDIYYFIDSGARNITPSGFFPVGVGEYMALGDNQPASSDSRDWGMVPRKNLRGPAIFRFWPLHRIQLIH